MKVIQSIRIIFIAQIMGVCLFAGVSFLNGTKADPTILNWIGIGSTLLSLALSQILPSKIFAERISKARDQIIEEKMKIYQTYKIVQVSILEYAALFNVAMFFMTKFDYNLYAASISVGMIIFNFPKKSDIAQIFQLNDREQRELNL